jgi:hypothetical protein
VLTPIPGPTLVAEGRAIFPQAATWVAIRQIDQQSGPVGRLNKKAGQIVHVGHQNEATNQRIAIECRTARVGLWRQVLKSVQFRPWGLLSIRSAGMKKRLPFPFQIATGKPGPGESTGGAPFISQGLAHRGTDGEGRHDA